MKQWIGTFVLCMALFALQAQQYCDFNNCMLWLPQSATVLGDTVNYATNQWSIDEWDNIDCNVPTAQCENLGLEVYYPSNLQANEKRPLLMLIHGGGFIGGSKADFRSQAMSIAQLGYVTATIDYRLCKRNNCLLLLNGLTNVCSLSWANEFGQSAYVAMKDGNTALKFLKQNSETYHIDTNNIIIGGHSAGALTAMLMAFTDQTEANTMAGGNGFAGLWGNIDRQQGIKGVFSLSGAAFDTTFIDANENIPTFIVHGTCDPTICYGTDAAFHCNSTYPEVYGGRDIALRMAHLNLNYYLYTGQDMGHDVGPQASKWLIELLYFARKNALCGEPVQKHVIDNLNPDSGECALLEGGLPGSHIRYEPAALTQSNPFGNFPAPCALPLSVNENNGDEIIIYPNPANNILNVVIPSSYNHATLQLFNMQGQLVYNRVVNGGTQSIDITQFPAGLYSLTIQTGNTYYSDRVIVTK